MAASPPAPERPCMPLPPLLLQACYVWYNEMYKCYSKEGEDADACKKIKKDVRCGRQGAGP